MTFTGITIFGQAVPDTADLLAPASNGGYALDNSAVETGERFAALSELFDAGTVRHIKERGITTGWHCLEVGGGGGSIAWWLSLRVGPSGRVLVTDIDTRFLGRLSRPNLEVRRHNVVTDPLPEGAFDLVHARLVLMHLPEREAVLARLMKASKPGGWLIVEEFDVLSLRPDPEVNRHEAVLNAHSAMNRVLAERGVDLRLGRSLFARLRAAGLTDVGAHARLAMGAGGSAAASLMRVTCCQLRDAMIERGHITAQDLENDLERLDSPDVLTMTPTLWAAWGRRPRND